MIVPIIYSVACSCAILFRRSGISFPIHLMQQLPDTFDLTSPGHHQLARNLAKELIVRHGSYADVQQPDSRNVFEELACRMARARLYALQSREPVKLLVVTNLLGENNRLRPKSDANPYGEDSLRRKVEEIEWLCQDTQWSADLLYVSGGDPWDSESVWRELAKRIQLEHPTASMRLVQTSDYPEWQDRNTNDKGGEWNLGLHLMASGQLESDYTHIYLTDADTTFNLAASAGEALMHSFENNWGVVLGNRKDPASILQKNANRSGPGVGWYYYISRHLGRQFVDLGILDTQCPSRLYSLLAAKVVDREATVDNWAIETDHNNALLCNGLGLHFIPVVAVDSEAESVGHKLPVGHKPDPAYRMTLIFQGQIEQLHKYRSRLELPHYEESARIAEIVADRLIAHDPSAPWAGLSKLLQSSYGRFADLGVSKFTPDEISIEEFEAVVDDVVGPPTVADTKPVV